MQNKMKNKLKEGEKPTKQKKHSIQSNLFSNIETMYHLGQLFAVILSAYLMVSIVNILFVQSKASELAFVSKTNLWSSLTLFVFCIAIMLVLKSILKNTHSLFYIMNFIVMFFGLLVILESNRNVYLTLGVTVIVAFILYYSSEKLNLDAWEIHPKKDYSLIVISIFFVIVSTVLAVATIYRFKTFNSFTYDLGIFTQMYESLRSTGLPNTTIERNQLLSHFAIHFSPIFYVLLPGYFVFRSPEYLLIMQAIIICSAVFPVYKLAMHYNLGKLNGTFISLCYLFYPGTLAPAFFDFHENKFLTVILLWMFYFFEKKNYKLMYLSLISVLLVKEDTALYIIFFGLYSILARKRYKHGIVTISLGVVYFIAVTSLMNHFGQGIMDSRFNIYQLPGESGLGVVAKNILSNPLFFVTKLFTEVKFKFILFMLAPLMFIPLVTKKWPSLILLVPMVVINLMTDYQYQFNIGNQYTYGVAAIMFYLLIINLKELPTKWIRLLCILTVFASLAFTLTATEDKFTRYMDQYNKNETLYVQTSEALAQIPLNASMTVDLYFSPHLYRVKELYLYPSNIVTEYLILDTRITNLDAENKKALIEKEGYKLYHSGGLANIYKREQE